ncbi:MAG: hypothetical protein NT075_30185 [Chloroflexi bacterium]|nr:hypothetical protein [Chloroflexota bacterium]
MWEIDYSNEAKFYFIDNGKHVFDLLVKISELAHMPEGIPPEGCTQETPGRYWWEVLRHIVIYRRLPAEKKLEILIVKPME